jgi:hypothetical protein
LSILCDIFDVLGLVMLIFSGNWLLLHQHISYVTFIACALQSCVGARTGPVGPSKSSITMFITHYGQLNSGHQCHGKERFKSQYSAKIKAKD